MKITKIALALVCFVGMVGVVARAQTQVFVPGNASGYFGNPIDLLVPLVPAITVNGPGTITVTYLSGTVTGSNGEAGPNGVPWDEMLPITSTGS